MEPLLFSIINLLVIHSLYFYGKILLFLIDLKFAFLFYYVI